MHEKSQKQFEAVIFYSKVRGKNKLYIFQADEIKLKNYFKT